MCSHGTLWLYFSRHRRALLLKQPFMALVDHVRVLRNPYGPARIHVVTTDYSRFAYGCSQARKASARARTVHVCRVDVHILTIPKNKDNP